MSSHRTKLTSIFLSGFKSFDSSKHQVEFGDITLLIGPNGSGKSNVLSFFNMLGYMMAGELQVFVGKQGGASSILHFGPKHTSDILAEIKFASSPSLDNYSFSLSHAALDSLIFSGEYLIEAKGDKQQSPFRLPLKESLGQRESWFPEMEKRNSGRFPLVFSLLKDFSVFQFNDTTSASGFKTQGYINDGSSLRRDGGNLAAFLYAIKEASENSKYYQRIVRHIRRVMPQFHDFVLRPSAANKNKIMLDWTDNSSDYLFGPHQISDGSLRFMALATLLLQPPETMPSILIIDEPELGLHPSAIAEFAGMVKIASSHSQVILATQSPRLLDEFELEQIVVVERDQITKSSFFPEMNVSKLEAWLEEYSLSEMWEKNVLGGKP